MKTTVRINKVLLLTDCEGVMITTRVLQTLAELLEEFQEGVLFLSSVGEHLQALLHEVVLDHAEDLILLRSLARDMPASSPHGSVG